MYLVASRQRHKEDLSGQASQAHRHNEKGEQHFALFEGPQGEFILRSALRSGRVSTNLKVSVGG